ATWKSVSTKLQPEIRKYQLQESKGINGAGNATDSQLATLIEFLDWDWHYIKSLQKRVADLVKSAEHNRRLIGAMVDDLLHDMKKAVMLPVSTLLEVFPKLVRELSRDHGKDVKLIIEGGDIEIDKRILEEMKDPLTHLLRNCIDHGIETVQERERKQKPPQGTITITVAQKNGRVEILVADDGIGIDITKVAAAALKLGLLSQASTPAPQGEELLPLIFHSGLSTSPIVTDISGRGLGLAIVRERVENLGGAISVETVPDRGSSFRILLPLTLATFRGTLVKVGEAIFVVPSVNVERVARIEKTDIKTVENRETIRLNGRAISLVRLGDALELPHKDKQRADSKFIFVLILGSADRRIAFSVDEILNEQEVMVKSLGKQLSRVRNIAGATILGTGKVVPVLNVADLMKSAVKVVSAPASSYATWQETGSKRKAILVAEDSITARALLKNILESAGYYVKTAVDGIDALTTLKTEVFDLVISDVDMPRMSGFDLTAKIRADQKLSHLPVILVTALERREDRERGIDVGANAYIIKSSFDQSNLLEVARRLI
ncbi:MAG: response regulator, partial [Acidobacteriota bacterium]